MFEVRLLLEHFIDTNRSGIDSHKPDVQPIVDREVVPINLKAILAVAFHLLRVRRNACFDDALDLRINLLLPGSWLIIVR